MSKRLLLFIAVLFLPAMSIKADNIKDEIRAYEDKIDDLDEERCDTQGNYFDAYDSYKVAYKKHGKNSNKAKSYKKKMKYYKNKAKKLKKKYNELVSKYNDLANDYETYMHDYCLCNLDIDAFSFAYWNDAIFTDNEYEIILTNYQIYLSKQLNIDPAEVEFNNGYFYNYDGNTVSGKCYPNNTIIINEKYIRSDGFYVVAHETRHAWQYTQKQYDFGAYIDVEFDFNEYYNQTIEVDARNYSDSVTELLYNNDIRIYEY